MTQARRSGSVRRVFVVLAALALLCALLAGGARPAHAATFTVTNTSGSGAGSLRQAITDANNAPGADTIAFDIPGSGVKTISPTSPLPAITDTATIDGYTQKGAKKNTQAQGTNAVLRVQINGANAGGSMDGLTIDGSAPNSVIRGLVINRFSAGGVLVEPGGSGNRIEGNFIGTDPSGQTDLGNANRGIFVRGAVGTTVGGDSPAKRNLISGNGSTSLDEKGVLISDFGAMDNKVEGNLIGTRRDGASALGNFGDGVFITEADNSVIGGTTPGAANVIAFNGGDGVHLERNFNGADPTGNRISGNSIFSNGGLGIDLLGGAEDPKGRTANDPGDPDSGPNELQNYPVLNSVKVSKKKGTTVRGTLNSTPGTTFVLRFFAGPSGDEEGKKYLGNESVTTDSGGDASFVFKTKKKASVEVTATATRETTGDTSEFSVSKKAVRR